jgi:acetate kinase
MKVLVINCGSSSLKYQVLDMPEEAVLAKGSIERIGIEGSKIEHEKTGNDKEYTVEKDLEDHKLALKELFDILTSSDQGVVREINDFAAVGHRVVHGGEKYTHSIIIDADVIKSIEEYSTFAPLHNPANLMGIRACQKLMPDKPMIAVFDTAFHQTMPPSSYIYAIPYKYYEQYGIRRYGFHGTSHKYVAERATVLMGRGYNSLKLITCHLGNGASISAIKRGKSIDTSMGFTPLPGLAMGTRSGSIDPSIIEYIAEKDNKSIHEIMNILGNESGMLGISGVSSDFRDVEAAIEKGNDRAALALEVFAHKVRFYIGAYIAEMNGLDGLIFTAGVGENDISARDVICSDLNNLGIKLDPIKNKIRGKEAIISKSDSEVTIMLIPTNEELIIARDTFNLATEEK